MFESGRFDNCHGDEEYMEAELREAINGEDKQKETDMLCLARRPGQKIMINEDITILIQSVDTSKYPPQVKVGIEAPMDYVIDREEIYLKKKKERKNEQSGNR